MRNFLMGRKPGATKYFGNIKRKLYNFIFLYAYISKRWWFLIIKLTRTSGAIDSFGFGALPDDTPKHAQFYAQYVTFYSKAMKSLYLSFYNMDILQTQADFFHFEETHP